MVAKKISKKFGVFVFVFVLLSLLSTNVFGLGVSPSSVTLIEGDKYFHLTIHNNEKINIDVSLSVSGDDFLELEKDSFSLSEDEDKKTIKVFIKDEDYRIDQSASIKVFESRPGDSMINVNLGLESSVFLIIPSSKALIEASIISSSRTEDGKGHYLVRLDNKGRSATSGEVFFKLNDYEETKTFVLEGLKRKDVSFYNEKELKLGSHEVYSKINYDDEEIITRRNIRVGTPRVDITQLVPLEYSEEILLLNAIIRTAWPEPITSEIIATTNQREFVSRTYTLLDTQKEIPLFINVLEKEETLLTLITNNQEPEQYVILVKDGVVHINEEVHYLTRMKQTNILFIIAIIILLILLLVVFLKKKKVNGEKSQN